MLPRLFLLIAVLLMPLAMNGAPAAAAGHHDGAAMPMQHCPEQGTHKSKAAFVECTMACASALPAMDRLHEPRMPYVELFVAETAVRALHGLHPETATPPPRIA